MRYVLAELLNPLGSSGRIQENLAKGVMQCRRVVFRPSEGSRTGWVKIGNVASLVIRGDEGNFSMICLYGEKDGYLACLISSLVNGVVSPFFKTYFSTISSAIKYCFPLIWTNSFFFVFIVGYTSSYS